MNRRVAVTGMGAVTALGPDVAALASGLREGRSPIGAITLFDTTGFRSRVGAQAPDPQPPLSEAQLGNSSRADRFGLQATFEAVHQAGLNESDLAEAAVLFGTGTGGAAITERYLRKICANETASVAMLVPHQPASVTDLVARHLHIRGPRTSIMTACSSSATAIGYAADRIRLGHVKVAVAGGAEGLCGLTFAGFSSLRATSPDLCRPFDAHRNGLNLGEGAAVLVLEEEVHARARGATILGFLAGYGITADAHHMTAPHPEGDGAMRAMRAALDDAQLSIDSVDYINAHGTATVHNDAAESRAVRTLLGERATRVPVSSIKSMVGHTLGSAGAIEAVASLIALTCQFIPPTVNLTTPDPTFGLDFVPGQARDAKLGVILSNSFAFGGNNTTLAFSRA